MESFYNRFAKNNITIKKLFDAILSLSQEQQSQLMIYVEGLLSENKRESVRKEYNTEITYATQNRIYSDRIADISNSGLFIETNRSLDLGEQIMVSFNLLGYDRPFKIKGKIVRSNQQGIGVEFKEIKPYIAEMLSALVERIKI